MLKMSVKKGMSFIEVVMAIGIFSMLMGGVTLLFIKAWEFQKNISETSNTSLAVYQGANKTIDNLRRVRQADNGAYPIKSADSFNLVVFSDIDKDGNTERLHYYLNNENFIVGVTNPVGQPPIYSVNDDEVEIVAKNIINTIAEPIFYYYNQNNEIITAPVTSLNDVKMIEVNLKARKNVNKSINIQSYASLRNLNEHDRIE